MSPAPTGTATSQGESQGIPITAQNYPVLHRWMELHGTDFQDEIAALAAIGGEGEQPDAVKRAIQAAVAALEALHRRI